MAWSKTKIEQAKMKKLLKILLTVSIIAAVLFSTFFFYTSQEIEKPEGTLSASELLGNPVYDMEVKIYGRVSRLGELLCPCFLLASDGENLEVWYGLMVEDDGTERPSVSVEGIENGDWVIVTGELKAGGIHYSPNDFWASDIKKIE